MSADGSVPSEQPIGIIWGPNIGYEGNIGYGLAVMPDVIIVGKGSVWKDGFERYIGPSSKQRPTFVQRTLRAVSDLTGKFKLFEIPKSSIVKAGIYHRGHITFVTSAQQYEFDIPFEAGATDVKGPGKTTEKALVVVVDGRVGPANIWLGGTDERNALQIDIDLSGPCLDIQKTLRLPVH